MTPEEQFEILKEATRVLIELKLILTTIHDAIPASFYANLPLPKRVSYMAEQWNRAVGVNQRLEDELHELRTAMAQSIEARENQG